MPYTPELLLRRYVLFVFFLLLMPPAEYGQYNVPLIALEMTFENPQDTCKTSFTHSEDTVTRNRVWKPSLEHLIHQDNQLAVKSMKLLTRCVHEQIVEASFPPFWTECCRGQKTSNIGAEHIDITLPSTLLSLYIDNVSKILPTPPLHKNICAQ